jgi:1,4-alpha-glucan branching enzyme
VRYAKDKKDFMVVAVNFTPVKYEYFPIGVPSFTDYEEIFNSDDLRYGGNNIMNRGVLTPKGVSEGEMPFSVRVTLPPFGAIILKPLK